MLKEKQQLYCSIRKIWVAATPEEFVRQEMLQLLTHSLGFSPSLIAVEKDFKLIPTTENQNMLSDRRVDIICYAKLFQESLHPLLVIECKAVPISSKELRQIIGYNHILKVPFIGLVNQNEKRLGWFDSILQDYKFINYFPKFNELVKSVNY